MHAHEHYRIIPLARKLRMYGNIILEVKKLAKKSDLPPNHSNDRQTEDVVVAPGNFIYTHYVLSLETLERHC